MGPPPGPFPSTHYTPNADGEPGPSGQPRLLRSKAEECLILPMKGVQRFSRGRRWNLVGNQLCLVRLRRTSNGTPCSAGPRLIQPAHRRGRRNPMRPKHVVAVLMGVLLGGLVTGVAL